MGAPELHTPRLRLRDWHDDDRAPWAELNADPEVMRWFPAPLDPSAANFLVDQNVAHLAEHGWGHWAIDVVHGDPAGFVGYAGVGWTAFEAPFGWLPEIGWRLRREAWGRGYAPEAAAAVLDHVIDVVGFEEVVSFTTEGNANSRRVMDKLGFTRDPADDFDHPWTPGWWGERCVLYRLPAERWREHRTTLPHRHPTT